MLSQKIKQTFLSVQWDLFCKIFDEPIRYPTIKCCFCVWECYIDDKSVFSVFQINTLPQRARGCSMPVSFLQEKMEELHLYKDKSREPDWAHLSSNISPHGQNIQIPPSFSQSSDWCWTDDIYWLFTSEYQQLCMDSLMFWSMDVICFLLFYF